MAAPMFVLLLCLLVLWSVMCTNVHVVVVEGTSWREGRRPAAAVGATVTKG